MLFPFETIASKIEHFPNTHSRCLNHQGAQKIQDSSCKCFLFRYLTACSLKYLHNISSRCTYIYINKMLLDTLHFRQLEAAPSKRNVAIQSECCQHLHRSQRQILQISQCASRRIFCLFMQAFQFKLAVKIPSRMASQWKHV